MLNTLQAMTNLRQITAALILFCVGSVSVVPLSAQTPAELAQLDPSDVYFQAWLLVRDAEKLEKTKSYVEAFDKYRKAQTFFNHLAINHPAWKPELVSGRQETTKDSLEGIRDEAIAQQKAQQKNFEGLVEDPSIGNPTAIPRTAKIDPAQQIDVTNLDQQIIQLKRQLTTAMNDRDANAARMRRALAELENERKLAISAPVKAELDKLNQEITKITSERDTLSHDLIKTGAALRETRHNLESTREELIASRQKEAELVKLIDEQRDVNFKVIKGQQAQLANLQKQMEEKDKVLAEADAHIRNLTSRLEASEVLVGELREERNSLVQERDNMATLLKINAADRVQELINQNVRLSRDLNEAKEKMALLDEDTNATKDELNEAKRTLIVAKTRILRLQEDSTTQKIRLKELQDKLDLANADLLARADMPGLSPASLAEIKTLRDIIKKQQRSLQVQEEARALLVEQMEREADTNEAMKQAVAQIKGTVSIELTDEEKDLIANEENNVAITSQFRASAAERRAAGNQLQQDKIDYNRLAKRAFGSGRLPVAQSFFETIVEEDPGDWEAFLNLGIVELRSEDPAAAAEHFRQAILIKGDRTLPYAHFQLGVCFYETELLDDSEKEMQTALNLDPGNAKAHVFLGNIAGRQNRFDEAEHHFTTALTIDATLSEPHMNLAILRLQQGKKKEALQNYHDALKRGAAPQPALETRLEPNS